MIRQDGYFWATLVEAKPDGVQRWVALRFIPPAGTVIEDRKAGLSFTVVGATMRTETFDIHETPKMPTQPTDVILTVVVEDRTPGLR